MQVQVTIQEYGVLLWSQNMKHTKDFFPVEKRKQTLIKVFFLQITHAFFSRCMHFLIGK
jgi:hypothetical protein